MSTKKKEATELSVEQKLNTLYDLQTTLSKIDEFKTLRGELPLEVQDLEDEIEGMSTRALKVQEDLANLNTEIAKKKEGIATAEASIARYKEQLNDVSNNREYDMLQKEIEYQGLEVQLLQKRIGEDERRIEVLRNDSEHISSALIERRADLEAKRTELEEIVSETQAEEEIQRARAKELEIGIEPRLLTAFKRIRKNTRNGLGIVPVERGACGGCFNRIPPQRALDIRMRKKVIVCEYCGRILVDPELAGIAVPEVEEKPKRRTRKTKTEE